jgi:hypothetical protein
MSIPSIPNSILQYLRRFDLSSIAQSRDHGGRLVVTRNPEGHAEAWWLAARDAGCVIAKARADGDVPRAAAALGIRCVEHAHMMQRTEEIVRRLDARLRTAQSTGALQSFNREFQRRRQAAFAQGRSYMGYSAARARLRQALTDAAAGKAAPGIIARVFRRFGSRTPR